MSATAISAGTSSHRTMAANGFALSDIEFAPACCITLHAHPRACAAVVVDGAVRKRFGSHGHELGPGGVVRMPPEEPHEDLFGREGARLVVVETDEGGGVSCFRDWGATLIAARIARELVAPDAFTRLALEGLALELVATVARGPSARPVEPWLERARELLHERSLELPTAAELAAEAGVHPSHFARSFRAAYGDSPGGYARRLRLEWAAARLVRSDDGIACVAAEAGFVDQSHFTRAFRRHFGLTPARFRAAHG
jgi:AraC family transcriptional regulator